MSLIIKCEACGLVFTVKGYTTPRTFDDPGELVTELESLDPLCKCLEDGGGFTLVDEVYESFEDDYL